METGSGLAIELEARPVVGMCVAGEAREFANGTRERVGRRGAGEQFAIEGLNEQARGGGVNGPAAGEHAPDSGIEQSAREALGIHGTLMFADAGGAGGEHGEAAVRPGHGAETGRIERIAGSEHEGAVAGIGESVSREMKDLRRSRVRGEVREGGLASLE